MVHTFPKREVIAICDNGINDSCIVAWIGVDIVLPKKATMS